MKTPDRELRRLTDAWHDGTILPEDALCLEKRLLEDAAARDYFFGISAIEGTLPAVAGKPPTIHAIPARAKPTGFFPTRWWKVAAVFLVGASCGFFLRKESVAETPVAAVTTVSSSDAARITGMLGISWNDPIHLHPPSPDSETRVDAGLVELTFASGTRALIEGPASFQVTDGNSMNLAYGKLVADVPKGAEGFTVAYADGKIVDLGTEFGVEVARDGLSANFGVFRGEIEFHPLESPGRVARLLENHAVIAESGNVTSVPFVREKFTRKLPSREFAWEVRGKSGETIVWNYDVSHLVWKPDSYRIICKWMRGKNGLHIESAELLLDGRSVDQDIHKGYAFNNTKTILSTYNLTVPEGTWRRGVWTLRLHVKAGNGKSADSSGVILMEEGLALNASKKDFLGTWEYLHDGVTYHRTFLEDGTARMTLGGVENPRFSKGRWKVENGILRMDVVDFKGILLHEEHLLRNSDTLIFTNQPYRDARRVKR